MSDKIAEAFGTEPTEIMRPLKIKNQIPATYDDFTKQIIEHRKNDYGTVRDNLINLLKDIESVVDNVIDEVSSNPSARMIESFSTLVKTFSEINKDLLSLTDKTGEQGMANNHLNDTENKPVNNVIFIGTSDSLIDQIRGQMK